MAAKKSVNLQLDTEIIQDNIPVMVVPRLYIGSIHSSYNEDALKERGITHVLNASRFQSTSPTQFTYLIIDIKDRSDSNLLACIPTANIFIEAGLQAGGVLVHCYQGKSRSAAFIAAYLMSSSGYGFDDVLGLLRSVRPIVSINKGFEMSLKAYAHTNFDVYVAQQVLLRARIRQLYELRGSAFLKSKSIGSLCNKRSFVETEEKLEIWPKNSFQVYHAPKCDLSRPHEKVVRIIPPLRGLDRNFSCRWCNNPLFNMSNVIRVDLNISPILDQLSEPKQSDRSCDIETEDMNIDSDYIDISTRASDGGSFTDFSAAADEKLSFTSDFSAKPSRSLEREASFGATIMSTDMENDENDYFSDAKFLAPMTSRAGSGHKGFDFDVPEPRQTRSADNFSILCPTPRSRTVGPSLSFDALSRADFGVKDTSAATAFTMPPVSVPPVTSLATYESPRIPIPAGASRESWSPSRQTAEKRRWLARLSLLDSEKRSSSDSSTCTNEESSNLGRLAKADDEAANLGMGSGKYIHLEYLSWMGDDLLMGPDEGDIRCNCCQNLIGSWSWIPHERHTLMGALETPLLRVLKDAVQEYDSPLDATPMTTPRPNSRGTLEHQVGATPLRGRSGSIGDSRR